MVGGRGETAESAGTVSWGRLWPGALLVGVGMQMMNLVSVFYLQRKITSSSGLYGGLGAAAVIILYAYFLARLIIGSCALNAIVALRRPELAPGAAELVTERQGDTVARHSVRSLAGVLTVVALALVGCDASTTGGADTVPSSSPSASASASPTPSATPSAGSNGRIAYSRFSGTSLQTAALEASRLDGTDQVALTRPQTDVKDQDPAWSHDGTKVAFDRETPKTGCGTGCITREIFVVDVGPRPSSSSPRARPGPSAAPVAR